MQSKYKVIGGSLVGAVAIHAAFVACGHAARTGTTTGPDGGVLDAMLDVIEDLVGDETRDAVAAGDAGEDGGTCGCTVSLPGPIQSLPASENSAQLMRGNLSGLTAAGSLVVTGPFVLTDLTAVPQAAAGNAGAATMVLQPAAANCTTLSGAADGLPGYVTTVLSDPPYLYVVHGGRYVVPAGQMLCAFNSYPGSPGFAGELQWAGFVPYQ